MKVAYDNAERISSSVARLRPSIRCRSIWQNFLWKANLTINISTETERTSSTDRPSFVVVTAATVQIDRSCDLMIFRLLTRVETSGVNGKDCKIDLSFVSLPIVNAFIFSELRKILHNPF